MCPISIEMLERMIPPTELVLLRTQKKTQTKHSHIHLWMSALLTEQSVSLYDLQYILCVHFLVLVCLLFFFLDRLLNGNTTVCQYIMFLLSL